AERTAYLRELGVVQRFQALAPGDQEAVRSGWPRVGMSADALLFVWGEPYDTVGDARRYAHWHYLGSSFGRSPSRNRAWDFGNRVDVYLVDGKVVGWVDAPLSTSANGGSSGGGGGREASVGLGARPAPALWAGDPRGGGERGGDLWG